MEEGAATTMQQFMTTLSTIADGIWTQVTKVCEFIIATPLLCFTVGFLLVGGAVGIVGRLISRG